MNLHIPIDKGKKMYIIVSGLDVTNPLVKSIG